MNMQQMMKQAQKMQKELAKAQEEVANMTAQGTAGGGMSYCGCSWRHDG